MKKAALNETSTNNPSSISFEFFLLAQKPAMTPSRFLRVFLTPTHHFRRFRVHLSARVGLNLRLSNASNCLSSIFLMVGALMLV